jgi:hypothetical protein
LDSDRTYYLTLDGYNLSKCKALFYPIGNYDGELTTIQFSSDTKIHPEIDSDTPKPKIISGLPL